MLTSKFKASDEAGGNEKWRNSEFMLRSNAKRARQLVLALSCAAVLAPAAPANAAEKVWHTALSLIRDPQYKDSFDHFNWVNPAAPKGGRAVMAALGTFDTLNAWPIQSNPASGLGLLSDTLMTASLDEPGTEYGLVAEAVSYPDDYSSVTFRLRPEAKFSDGTPVTPEDVIFSMEKEKEVSPNYAAYYKNVVKGEKTGEHEVTFTFDVKNNRELPYITAEITILSKAFWTGKNKDGQTRDISKASNEPPLGSGPYLVKSFVSGSSITYLRRDDYWAKDLPVMRGRWNIGELKWEYFQDQTVAFEAFKSGNVDFYTESSSKSWATAYDFPAVNNGLIVKERVDLKSPEPMQCLAINLRKTKFEDPRVREALNLAFDFEWSNKNLFYNQYVRTSSYFQNTELASKGPPQGRELEVLQEIKDLIPPEALTAGYENPVNADEPAFRNSLRKASKLLKDAGWSLKDGVLTNEKTGEPLTFEITLVQSFFERVLLPYTKNLERLGIKATIRTIDETQYVRRVEGFDFEMIVHSIPQSESPGNEQRDFWGSAMADVKGSRNTLGIKNPAVDKLVDKIIFAKDRDELVAVTHALDRVLLWNHYVIPQWHVPYDRIAYWNKYKRSNPGPSLYNGFPTVWWYDQEAAAKVEPMQNK